MKGVWLFLCSIHHSWDELVTCPGVNTQAASPQNELLLITAFVQMSICVSDLFWFKQITPQPPAAIVYYGRISQYRKEIH